MRMTKTGVIGGFAVLAIAGAGVGVAAADTGGGTSGGSSNGVPAELTASTTTSNTTGTDTRGKAPKGGKARRAWLRRVEHGQVTVRDGRTFDIQRGIVESVDATTITVKCKDGYVGSYAVTGTTKVRHDKQASSISQVTDGDRVLVIGQKSSTADTALRVYDPGKPKSSSSSSSTD